MRSCVPEFSLRFSHRTYLAVASECSGMCIVNVSASISCVKSHCFEGRLWVLFKNVSVRGLDFGSMCKILAYLQKTSGEAVLLFHHFLSKNISLSYMTEGCHFVVA